MAEKIFDFERLLFRFKTFEQFCMQSLMDQKIKHEDDISFTLLILYSDALPDYFKGRLSELSNMFNKNTAYGKLQTAAIKSTLRDVSTDSHKNMNEAIKYTILQHAQSQHNDSDCTFATVRLDDDDALSENFITEVGKYLLPTMAGMCISFPYGFEGYVDPTNLAIKDIRHCYFPKIALGLSYINHIKNGDVVDKKTFHVLNTNNHTKVDERYPVIMDARLPMYFRALSFTNDSNGSPHHSYLPKVNGRNMLASIPCAYKNTIDLAENIQEDFFSLEISKKASPAAAMIASLNSKLANLRNIK